VAANERADDVHPGAARARSAARALIAVALTVAPVLGIATSAAAAVAAEPSAVAPGDVVTFAFQVVNDRAPAATTRVEIDFPEQPPIVNVDAVPVAGWTIRLERRDLAHPFHTPDGPARDAVRRLVWTGGPLRGAEVVRFAVHAGPIATSVRHVPFTAVQTYDDGTVIRWRNDPGKTPSRHPAPYLDVSRYAASRAPGAADPLNAPFNLTEKRAIDRRVRLLVRNGQIATPDDVESARWLSVVAVITGLAGLVLGGAAFVVARGNRRRPSPERDRDEGGTPAPAVPHEP
jgi:uncharacterized protein YcnI